MYQTVLSLLTYIFVPVGLHTFPRQCPLMSTISRCKRASLGVWSYSLGMQSSITSIHVDAYALSKASSIVLNGSAFWLVVQVEPKMYKISKSGTFARI